MTHANPSTHRAIARLMRLTAIALTLLLLAALARADEVRTNNLWIPNVNIQNVINSDLYYTTSSGAEVNIPLSRVQGIKVPAYPDFWAGQEAFEAGRYREALPLFLKVQGTARIAWLKNHAGWLKTHTFDKLGQPVQAVEAYLDLARDKPDVFYLQRPPLESLEKATDVQKKDLTQRLDLASPDFEGVAQAAITAMIQKLGAPAEAQQGQPAAPAANGQTTPATPALPAIVDGSQAITNKTGIVFSTTMLPPDRDPVTPLLYQGKWQEAADKARELLAGPETRMSMRLYQLGMAQLQLAKASGSQDAYKDAGLSFARSLIYFPSGATSGANLVELAQVHVQIGRPDLAIKLLEKARLQVDEQNDPALYERMETLVAQLADASTAPPPPEAATEANP